MTDQSRRVGNEAIRRKPASTVTAQKIIVQIEKHQCQQKVWPNSYFWVGKEIARRESFRSTNVSLGSLSEVEPSSCEVCFTAANGHRQLGRSSPFRANTGSDAQPISAVAAVAPLRVAIRGIGNRGADANADAEEFRFLV
jgi:hypothetical protein